ncbi:MAG: 5'-methylthioadenosine/adenosylhomocysteine nucleosidase [Bacteroidota bacterium]
MTERIIGIMSAMPEEIDGVVDLLTERQELTKGMRTYYSGKINNIPTVVVFSRWGKVAAATTVANLILDFNITELIFTGVAGAINHELNIGDIVIGSRLVQHDLDARPLIAQFEIPLLGMTHVTSPARQVNRALVAINELLSNKHLHAVLSDDELKDFGITNPKVLIGDISSGDKFFSSNDDKLKLQNILPNTLCVEMEGAAVAQVCYEYEIPFTIIRTISDSADDNSHVDFQSFIRHIASKYSVEIIKNIYSVF